MDEFKRQTVILSLRDMFKSSHFSICTIDKCIKILGIIPPQSDRDTLSALHCIRWSEMMPQFRERVMEKVLALMTHEGFDLSRIDILEISEPKKVKRLAFFR